MAAVRFAARIAGSSATLGSCLVTWRALRPSDSSHRESQLLHLGGSSLRYPEARRGLLEHYAGRGTVEIGRLSRKSVSACSTSPRSTPSAGCTRCSNRCYASRTWSTPSRISRRSPDADASFDLRARRRRRSSTIPDFRRALAETRRVLRQERRHVFSVPLDPRLERTRSREGMAPHVSRSRRRALRDRDASKRHARVHATSGSTCPISSVRPASRLRCTGRRGDDHCALAR